jgi:hypothetical protein
MDDAVAHAAAPLTHERLQAWQASLFPTGFSGMSRVRTGAYRDHAEPMHIVSGRPGREKVHYEAPPSPRVPGEMDGLIAWFNRADEPDNLACAALAHLWLETIHPFKDGNGRVGRVLIDLVLARQRRSQPADTHLAAPAGKAHRLLRRTRTRPARLDRRDGMGSLVHRPGACRMRAGVRGDGCLAGEGAVLVQPSRQGTDAAPAQGDQCAAGRGAGRLRRRHEHQKIRAPDRCFARHVIARPDRAGACRAAATGWGWQIDAVWFEYRRVGYGAGIGRIKPLELPPFDTSASQPTQGRLRYVCFAAYSGRTGIWDLTGQTTKEPFVLSRPKAVSKEGNTVKPGARCIGRSFDTSAAQPTQDERTMGFDRTQ